jgi:hypothetical protein
MLAPTITRALAHLVARAFEQAIRIALATPVEKTT